MVHPGKLARGLRNAALAAGVRVFEHTAVERPRGAGAGVELTAAGGSVAARRALLATSAYPPLVRSVAPLRAAGVRLRADDRAAEPGSARVDRLVPPPGARRLRQPVPLLPAERGRPHPLRRLRRRVPLRRPGGLPARRPRGDLRHALPALLHDVPAARGRAFHPPLGRRDRHLQPLLGVLRHRAGRPGRLRHRLHRARRGRQPLRRRGGAGPRRRQRDGGHPPALRAQPAGARSRPSRCAPAWCASPRTASRRPTAHEGRRGLWLRALDRAGLGFDS